MPKTIFSKEVQNIMESNGDHKRAKFVELVQHWFEACDERGIKPNEHVNHWIDMHNFLVKDVDFTNFPPPSTHVKGIPIVTDEGLLQGITTCIMLYQISMTKTFNNRGISTLGIESLSLSSLSKADMMMTGCPKAVQIHRILPIMMQYKSCKYDPDKIFQMNSRYSISIS